MIDKYLFRKEVNSEEHIIAEYSVKSKDLLSAAKAIAIGQSIGNPEVRTQRDTPEIFENNLAKIIKYSDDKTFFPVNADGSSKVKIAYPLVNFGDGDGITQLLCTVMGGQMDIDAIESCRLESLEFPKEYLSQFQGPKIGMEQIKKRTKALGRPLLGGIVKPKTGINVKQLEGLVEELLEGGVDFIKEDEILGNPYFCKFEDRVPRVADLVRKYEAKQNKEIFYAACINSDFPTFVKRAELASKNGLKAVHLNFHAGLPAYKVLRDLDLPDTAIFFQKSGDKVLTSTKNPYSISWPVVNSIARMTGSDFIHAGMWGGYLSDGKEDLGKVMNILQDGTMYKKTVPSLSCGSHPGLVDTTKYHFGENLMMNVGGAIQGHPMGTVAGARAMRQAMDKSLNEDIKTYMNDKPELKAAIEKWGYVKP